ncbi:MAG: efflux RND transporter periplasmic adaptor subunit [Rikenellaceae bacterium]
MKNLRVTPLLALVAISFTLFSCKESVKPQVEKSYKTLTVAKSNTSNTLRYTASIRAEQFVDIRPQVSGVITQILIKEGAQVKSGESLFVIDQVPYKAALDVARANVKSAEVGVATAKLNAQSAESLYDEDVISKNELQVLQNTLSSAEAALALAKAQEVSAQNDLSYTVVKSPVDGVASMINYRVGALVSSSITSPLVSLSKSDNMYAYFSISEATFMNMITESGSSEALLEKMGDVALTLGNGTQYPLKGRVDAISGVIEQSTGTVSLRAVFENPAQILRDGGNGAILIKDNIEDVIVVPQVATYEIQNKTFVYRVVDGKATSAVVVVAPCDNPSEYIVTSGLSAGDVIVAEGAGLMREGTVVNAK